VDAVGGDWRPSSGSLGEVREMVEVLKRPVFHDLDALARWLKAV
jgi:hypothetical protein